MSRSPRTPNCQSTHPNGLPVRNLFIRGVPEEVWEHVHHNALRSRLPLKNYLINLMRQSQPFPRPSPDGQSTMTPGDAETQGTLVATPA